MKYKLSINEMLKELQLNESHYRIGNEIRIEVDFKFDFDCETAINIFNEMFNGKTAFDHWERDFSPMWIEIPAKSKQIIIYSSLGEQKTKRRMVRFCEKLYANDIPCHVKFDGEPGGWNFN